MGLFDFLKRKGDAAPDEDALLLKAEPISRKRMDLLWLDPQKLQQMGQVIAEDGFVTVVWGESPHQREHRVTQEDYDWAKGIESVVDEAYAANQRGDFAATVRLYKKALELAPGCDLFLMSVGSAYAHLGQKAKALRYLERAAKISPVNKRIRSNLENVRRM